MSEKKNDYSQKLSEYLGEMDDSFIKEAYKTDSKSKLYPTAEASPKRRRQIPVRYVASIAACLILCTLVGVIFTAPRYGGLNIFGSSGKTTPVIGGPSSPNVAPGVVTELDGFANANQYVDMQSIKYHSDYESVYFTLDSVSEENRLSFNFTLHNDSEELILYKNTGISVQKSMNGEWQTLFERSDASIVTSPAIMVVYTLSSGETHSKKLSVNSYLMTPGTYRYAIEFCEGVKGEGVALATPVYLAYVEFTLTDIPHDDVDSQTSGGIDISIPDPGIDDLRGIYEIGFHPTLLENPDVKELLISQPSQISPTSFSLPVLKVDSVNDLKILLDLTWNDSSGFTEKTSVMDEAFFEKNLIYFVYLDTPNMGDWYDMECVINSNKTRTIHIYQRKEGDMEAFSGWMFMYGIRIDEPYSYTEYNTEAILHLLDSNESTADTTDPSYTTDTTPNDDRPSDKPTTYHSACVAEIGEIGSFHVYDEIRELLVNGPQFSFIPSTELSVYKLNSREELESVMKMLKDSGAYHLDEAREGYPSLIEMYDSMDKLFFEDNFAYMVYMQTKTSGGVYSVDRTPVKTEDGTFDRINICCYDEGRDQKTSGWLFICSVDREYSVSNLRPQALLSYVTAPTSAS